MCKRSVEELLQRKTLRFRWEKLKLEVSEWFLEAVLRRPSALESQKETLEAD